MASFEHPDDLTPTDDEFSAQDTPHEGVMLGNSPAMKALHDQIVRVARTDAPVLLIGESGTGKELAASTIHALSRRRDGPFLALHWGAISPRLLESELFGTERGNGNERMQRGCFERAHRGTLFLDGISQMPEDLQAKLLRVLEQGTLMRVGSRTEIRVDVRVISATDRNLKDQGLRPDFYQRLAVFPLLVPPLRQRGSDVRLLASHFLNQLNHAHGTRKAWSAEALERMDAHTWPGNVRELRNHVERAYALSDGMVDAAMSQAASAEPAPGPTTSNNAVLVPVGTSLEEACRALILATLEHCGGVRKRAAEMLGISLKTLYNKLVAYRAQARAGAPMPPAGLKPGHGVAPGGD